MLWKKIIYCVYFIDHLHFSLTARVVTVLNFYDGSEAKTLVLFSVKLYNITREIISGSKLEAIEDLYSKTLPDF